MNRLHATPPNVVLCRLDALASPGARNFVLRVGADRFHGFVVRYDRTVHGYVDRCPHAGLPLAQVLDQYLSPNGDLIVCSWHGAVFDPQTGQCRGGPCAGAALSPWPVEIRDGAIVTSKGDSP